MYKAKRTYSENIEATVSDLDGIRDAITEKGIFVPNGVPTHMYRDMILRIGSGHQHFAFEDAVFALPGVGITDYAVIDYSERFTIRVIDVLDFELFAAVTFNETGNITIGE